MLYLKEAFNQDFPGLIQNKGSLTCINTWPLNTFSFSSVIYPQYLLNSNPITKNQSTNAMHCYTETQPHCPKYLKASKTSKSV